MPFIDNTYFKGRIYLADIQTGNSPVVGNTVTVDYIALYEPEYLKKALGYNMYKAFTDGLAVIPTPEQRWIDLRDGKEYTVNDVTYKWNGFKNSEKVSPIAYYVYCQYLDTQATNVTGIGTVVNNKQNATSVSPASKIFSAWHNMNELNCSLYHFLHENVDTYPEFKRNEVESFGSRNPMGI